MSGYIGNPDAEAEHAMVLAENGIEAARSMMPHGPTSLQCWDCGEDIPRARREAVPGVKYCIDCQEDHDRRPQIKMLDRIL